ncbi:MAG: DUF167 domain-containing protein [Pirellulaceae bacterium]|nr:DUF167 domain-containing protein [Pirellulaceae bacterium]
MIDCSGNSCRLRVHATPGAKQTRVGGQYDNALRVSVTAPADKGQANKAIVKALADALRLKRSQIELLSGATNRRKVFLIANATPLVADRVAELASMG